ncbi:dicarboxylic amino acid permease [Venturia nashicola]|uniref:Dicarboxylic amino acid permease n=1 Tax=Venturia nashicola TaxID=86259 RepID=A0A4Z1NWB2_9PEZI|nr:dicarboxylic amino acid permease [Venturia nashicola]
MRKFSPATMFKNRPNLVAVERRSTHSSISTDPDVEHAAVEQGEGLKRELSPRDLNMIAFSGSVGTGLIIGTGKRRSWITTGLFPAHWLRRLGFAGYATRFVDPCLGFATGWNYFLKYVILLPTNLTASGMIIQYWKPDLNVAIFVTIFGIGLVALNLFHVSNYGRVQFYLGWTKIIIVVAMMCAGIATSSGGGPHHRTVGFRYWTEAFRDEYNGFHGNLGRFLAWWFVLVSTCFAYTGAEIVGASFGEVSEPRKNIPKAIRLTAIRILLIYILAVFVITISVNPNSPLLLKTAGENGKGMKGISPFVVAVKEAGIKFLPDIFNAGLLVFVISAANADVYTASRTLYGLSHDSQAPGMFGRTNLKGVPWQAVIVSSFFIVLGYMNATKSAAQVFKYFVDVSTVFGVLNWMNILLAYFGFVRAMQAQGFQREYMPYRCFCQPYSGIFALIVSILVIVFSGYESFVGGFDPIEFITHYIGVFAYLFFIAFWKITKRTKMVDPKEASLSPNDEEGTGQGLPPAESVGPSDLTSNNLGSQTLTEAGSEKTEERIER